jgi:hypothetical protein
MPALTNQRQERFCQLVKQGVPAYRAYPMAGYRANNGAPYRLAENVRVKRRLAELTRAFAVKTKVSVESLTSEFDEAIQLARATTNPAALTNAAIAKAKLHGLMVDRKEQGAPGEFSALDADQIVAKLRAERGDAVADLLVTALSKAQAAEAQAELDDMPDAPSGAIN